MGTVLNYFDEIKRSMEYIAQDERSVFLGQCVGYPGNILYKTVCDIDASKRIEVPVMEDCQMGMSIGLALNGLIPVTIYPRWDFLILATNHLVNHLNKFSKMTNDRVNPKIIVRVCVGSTKPLYPGPQHCSDYTEIYEKMLENVNVVKLERSGQVFDAYKNALVSDRSTILVELADLY